MDGGLWIVLSPNGMVNFGRENMPQAKSSGNTLEMWNHPSLGDYVTTADGSPMYVFEIDAFLKTNCTNDKGCLTDWPPMFIGANDQPTVGKNLDAKMVYWIETQGKRQVTYNGWPLYYYKGELNSPGTIKCQNIDMNGGYWWIIRTDGKVIKENSAALFKVGLAIVSVIGFILF
jgi:predicted lipoprotein with Yx(FWY)xxD motif